MMSAKVPFNNASNAGRGRARGDGQRSVLTYVRGKIDSTVVDGETVDRTLRGNTNAWGAVAVTFERSRPEGADDIFTAARLWHVPRSARSMEDVRTRLVTADGPLDLRTARARRRRTVRQPAIDLRPGLAVHAQPGSFVARLYQRLHIGKADNGEKAMSLLASVQAGRSVDDVVGLYRDLVLEEPATFAAAESAVNHFAALEAAHAAMIDAENQQTTLAPIREAHAARETALARAHAIEALELDVTPMVGSASWQARTVVELAESQLGVGVATLTATEAEAHAATARERAALQPSRPAKADPAERRRRSSKASRRGGRFREDLREGTRCRAPCSPPHRTSGCRRSTMEGFLCCTARSRATHRYHGRDRASSTTA